MKVICVIGGMRKHQSWRTDGIVPTLVSSMGTGGGYVPMIIIENESQTSCEVKQREQTKSQSIQSV